MPGFRQNVDCLLWEDRGRCMERQDYKTGPLSAVKSILTASLQIC